MRPGDTPRPPDAGSADGISGGCRRIVLVHGWAPPTRGGTAFVVARVFSHMDGVALSIWTRATQWRAVRHDPFVLPGRYRYFLKLRSVPRGPRVFGWVVTVGNLALAVLSGLVIGVAARRERARWIVSIVDEGFSQIAGAVASGVARVPHVVWVFDLWQENAYAVSDRRVARWLEGRIWRSAAALVVHAEELAEHYDAKHGVRAHVLRTPIDDSAVSRAACDEPPAGAGAGWEVLVAGSVYWAQSEALRRIAAAVRQVDGASLTVIGDPKLQTERIDADHYEPATSGAELQARLKRARLLVLGLSFDTEHPDLIATATPARLPEYLASGVPVLVHAPAGSHAVEHVRRQDLAAVVDRPEVAAVADAIRAIKDDAAASAARAERARGYVAAHHQASAVSRRFTELLNALPDDRPLRVLVNATAVRAGGGGTFVVSQIAALARRRDVALTVIATGDVARQLEAVAGLRVGRPPTSRLAGRLLWEHTVVALRSRRFDVLYCAGNFALPLARVPQVVTMQNALLFGDDARRFRSHRCARPWRARLACEAALARLSVRRAFAAVAISQSLRAAIEQDMGRLPSIHAIPAATPMLPPAGAAAAGRYVLSVAHDHPHKDWDALVAAFGRDPHLPALVAVGAFTPARRHTLEESVAPGRVRFLGTITDRAELAGLYAGATCCVVHSWIESFGLTALEALVCGSPVIASDIAAHREVGGDEVAYYAPGDMVAFGRLLRETVVARTDGPGTARATMPPRTWTWDDNAAELAAVLNAAAALPPRRRRAAARYRTRPRTAIRRPGGR